MHTSTLPAFAHNCKGPVILTQTLAFPLPLEYTPIARPPLPHLPEKRGSRLYSWLDKDAGERAARATIAAYRAAYYLDESEPIIAPGGALPPVNTPRGLCRRTNRVTLGKCAHGHVSWRWRACLRYPCRACADAIAERRGGRLYRRYGAAGFLVIVVTWPGSWRELARVHLLRAWGLDVRATIRSWLESELRAGIGGLEYLHPTGDKTAQRKEVHPHLNYLIPLAGISAPADGTSDTTAGPLCWPGCAPGWVPAAALRRLRDAIAATYARVASLYDCTATPAAPVALVLPPVNVFVEYRKPGSKARHACRYFARPWPEWTKVMRAYGLGTCFGLLHPGAARTSDEARKALLAYIAVNEEPTLPLHVCPTCKEPIAPVGDPLGYSIVLLDPGDMARGPPGLAGDYGSVTTGDLLLLASKWGPTGTL